MPPAELKRTTQPGGILAVNAAADSARDLSITLRSVSSRLENRRRLDARNVAMV